MYRQLLGVHFETVIVCVCVLKNIYIIYIKEHKAPNQTRYHTHKCTKFPDLYIVFLILYTDLFPRAVHTKVKNTLVCTLRSCTQPWCLFNLIFGIRYTLTAGDSVLSACFILDAHMLRLF